MMQTDKKYIFKKHRFKPNTIEKKRGRSIAALFLCCSLPAMAHADEIIYSNGDPLSNDPLDSAIQSLYPSNSTSNNNVLVNSGTINGMVYGGLNKTSGDSSNNNVLIKGGSIGTGIIGGYANNGNVKNNTVTVQGNTFLPVMGTNSALVGGGNGLYGGYVKTGNAEENIVNINLLTGPPLAISTYGGFSENGHASKNIVNVIAGTIGSNIYGGYTQNGNATNNHVNISGTHDQLDFIYSEVYGGYTENGNATGNTITLSSNADLASLSLIGGYSGNGGLVQNNTLNVHGQGMEVTHIAKFDHYNFLLPTALTNTPLLETQSIDNISGHVSIKLSAGSEIPALGTQTTLLTSVSPLSGTPANQVAQANKGVSLVYDFGLSTDTNNLYATLKNVQASPQAKALNEGRLAGLAFTTQGSELVADQGIKAALASASLGDSLLTAFGTASGSSSRYNSGSHIDVDGVSMMTGLAWKLDNLVLAEFLEGGDGNYDSYNSFNNAASVQGSGDVRYYGIGVLGRYTLNNGVYLDGTARVGRVNTKFNSQDMVNEEGTAASYDSKSTYYSTSIGAGYEWKLNNQTSLDMSTQYLWTHQNGDSVTVAGDPIDFAAADSHRWRTLGRLYHDVTPQVTMMAGLGYEYEFDGKVKGTAYHRYDIDAPSIKGGTGIGELGMSFNPNSAPNLTFDAKLRGYAGKREGFAGFAQVKYAF